mgnify:CR=1 FL=1
MLISTNPYVSIYHINHPISCINCKNRLLKRSDYISQKATLNKFKLDEPWVILNEIENSIKNKIETYGTPLKEWKNIIINRGVLTGCNEAFIINDQTRQNILDNCLSQDEMKKTDELIRPVLRGKDIKRLSYTWSNLFLITTYPVKNIDIENYPSIKDYLQSADWSNTIPHSYGKLRLEQTGKTHLINGIKIQARKQTGNKWFETQDQIAYMDEFDKHKIVFPAIMKEGAFFSMNYDKSIVIAPGNIITGENLEKLLLVLTSVGYFALRKYYMGGGIEGELKVNRLLMLPVPTRINEIKNEDEIYDLYDFNSDEKAFIKAFLR